MWPFKKTPAATGSAKVRIISNWQGCGYDTYHYIGVLPDKSYRYYVPEGPFPSVKEAVKHAEQIRARSKRDLW